MSLTSVILMGNCMCSVACGDENVQWYLDGCEIEFYGIFELNFY